MWRRSCPVLIGLLAIALVVTWRRLTGVEAYEVERARAEARAGAGDGEPESGQAESGAGGAHGPGGGVAAATTTATSDLASEWEQGVPPMDS